MFTLYNNTLKVYINDELQNMQKFSYYLYYLIGSLGIPSLTINKNPIIIENVIKIEEQDIFILLFPHKRDILNVPSKSINYLTNKTKQNVSETNK